MQAFRFLEKPVEDESKVIDEFAAFFFAEEFAIGGSLRSNAKKRLRALIRYDEKKGRTPWLKRGQRKTTIKTASFLAWAKQKKNLRPMLDPGGITVVVENGVSAVGYVGEAHSLPGTYAELLAEFKKLWSEHEALKLSHSKLESELTKVEQRRALGKKYGGLRYD
ncbi:MAG TPA: hypothetical protein DCY55_12320 [Gammaproteobacteria bacterium]|nr:hypothetical protein [Gammaproteobacteria bacterium]